MASQQLDSSGRTVWVCTLQGLQQLLSEDGDSQKSSSSPMQCPACSLGQLFDSLTTSSADLLSLRERSRAFQPVVSDNYLPYHRFSSVQVRAPPQA